MLQCFTQHTVKSQVRSDNVLLNPHVRTESLDLMPKAIKILFLGMRVIRLKHTKSIVVDLATSLDVALQRPQHPVQLALLLLVQLPAHPGEGGQHAVGEPVPSHLRHAVLQCGVDKVVQKLEQRSSGDDVTVDQVCQEPQEIAGIGPFAGL